ncbi:uncharacterized protein LOC135109024 isoform X1 [Scylla paramamosain]|uniref:uncharacterized protein LOC135109024 isoform X1 n=1 Tax=Scylla paramamosain TaxID=85552 RepID=UPI00308393C6
MKNTPAFFLLLLPLLLLLLTPGGYQTRALALQCFPSFKTVDHEYSYITNASTPKGDHIKTTMYVRPHRDLKVVLRVFESANHYHYTCEFFLGKDCFKGNRLWWNELWVSVKYEGTYSFGRQVRTYEFQVRTSTCIKPCIGEAEKMRGVGSLHVLASGASQWRLDHSGTHCGTIYQRSTDRYWWPFPSCTYVNLSSLLITSVKYTTPTKPTTTPTTLTTNPTTLTTNPTTSQAAKIGGITGGLVAGIVVVAVIVMIVVRKRRGEPAKEDVAMHPQNTESPREENVNSLYEPTYRQEPLYENVDRQGFVNSLYGTVDRQGSVNSLYGTVDRQGSVNSLYGTVDRQGSVNSLYGTVDRQGSVNSLYGTVDRQGSVNSLYEPFEKFRGSQ